MARKQISKETLKKLHNIEVKPASLKAKKLQATVGLPIVVKANTKTVKMIHKVPSKVKSVKVASRKPLKCYIYRGYLKEFPHISITQVRFHPFDYLEDCIEWCKLHLLTWEIKDEKGNKQLATNDSQLITTSSKTPNN